MALAAADIAETEGLRGLRARSIAREIGYTIGTIYNVFEGLDDLIVHLNDTALAECYIRFTRDHSKRWSVLFEHRLPNGRELPEWHHEKVLRLLEFLERALARLFSPGQEKERHHTAHVPWSSLHGICSLETAGKLAETESLTAMADSLVTHYLAGLPAILPLVGVTHGVN